MIRGVCYRYFNETRVSTPHEEVLPVPLKQAWKYWYNRVELRALRIQCCRKNVCLYVLRNQVSYIRRLPISSTNPMLRTMTQYRYSNRLSHLTTFIFVTILPSPILPLYWEVGVLQITKSWTSQLKPQRIRTW